MSILLFYFFFRLAKIIQHSLLHLPALVVLLSMGRREQPRKEEKKMTRKTGYHVYLMGLRSWYRSEARAVRAAESQTWCSTPQVIEVATGRLVYGSAA